MKYKTQNAKEPAYLVLSMEYRQAIKLQVAESIKKNSWEVLDITNYMGIPIIKEEEIIIFNTKSTKVQKYLNWLKILDNDPYSPDHASIHNIVKELEAALGDVPVCSKLVGGRGGDE